MLNGFVYYPFIKNDLLGTELEQWNYPGGDTHPEKDGRNSPRSGCTCPDITPKAHTRGLSGKYIMATNQNICHKAQRRLKKS